MVRTMKTLLPALALLAAGAVSCSGQKTFTLPNTAMEPTIIKGEKFTVEMKPFQPSRGDLVVFEHDRILRVKRVIAVAGDTIKGRDNQILVNGSLLNEPYIEHVGPPHGPLATFGPVTVPAGRVFVAGDNRDYSLDNRTPAFGLVAAGDIKGKPVEIVQSSNAERVHRSLQ